MNYQALILPLPANSQDVQSLINASVPPGKRLVSTSVFPRDGQLMILIVVGA